MAEPLPAAPMMPSSPSMPAPEALIAAQQATAPNIWERFASIGQPGQPSPQVKQPPAPSTMAQRLGIPDKDTLESSFKAASLVQMGQQLLAQSKVAKPTIWESLASISDNAGVQQVLAAKRQNAQHMQAQRVEMTKYLMDNDMSDLAMAFMMEMQPEQQQQLVTQSTQRMTQKAQFKKSVEAPLREAYEAPVPYTGELAQVLQRYQGEGAAQDRPPTTLEQSKRFGEMMRNPHTAAAGLYAVSSASGDKVANVMQSQNKLLQEGRIAEAKQPLEDQSTQSLIDRRAAETRQGDERIRLDAEKLKLEQELGPARLKIEESRARTAVEQLKIAEKNAAIAERRVTFEEKKHGAATADALEKRQEAREKHKLAQEKFDYQKKQDARLAPLYDMLLNETTPSTTSGATGGVSSTPQMTGAAPGAIPRPSGRVPHKGAWPEENRNYYEPMIRAEARRQGVPEDLAVAIAYQESHFDPYQEGDNGNSIGLFQLQPAAAREMGLSPEERRDPEKNIRAGIGYFKKQLQAYGGNEDAAIKRYNGGGDKDYVKHVRSRLPDVIKNTPRAQIASAPKAAPASAPTTAPASIDQPPDISIATQAVSEAAQSEALAQPGASRLPRYERNPRYGLHLSQKSGISLTAEHISQGSAEDFANKAMVIDPVLLPVAIDIAAANGDAPSPERMKIYSAAYTRSVMAQALKDPVLKDLPEGERFARAYTQASGSATPALFDNDLAQKMISGGAQAFTQAKESTEGAAAGKLSGTYKAAEQEASIARVEEAVKKQTDLAEAQLNDEIHDPSILANYPGAPAGIKRRELTAMKAIPKSPASQQDLKDVTEALRIVDDLEARFLKTQPAEMFPEVSRFLRQATGRISQLEKAAEVFDSVRAREAQALSRAISGGDKRFTVLEAEAMNESIPTLYTRRSTGIETFGHMRTTLKNRLGDPALAVSGAGGAVQPGAPVTNVPTADAQKQRVRDLILKGRPSQ